MNLLFFDSGMQYAVTHKLVFVFTDDPDRARGHYNHFAAKEASYKNSIHCEYRYPKIDIYR